MSTSRPPGLPDFGAPPVVEVAFAVRFEPLPRLTTAEIGRLWSERYPEFSTAADEPLLPPEIESLDDGAPIPRFMFRFGSAAQGARVVLADPASEHLVQLQHDLFGTNWRKRDSQYPRFESLSAHFAASFAAFTEYLESRRLGRVEPTHCELTYVNQLDVPNEGEVPFARLPQMVSVLTPPAPDASVLNNAEDFSLSFRYRMRDEAGRPIGRLYLRVAPGRAPGEDTSVYLMTLSAKGPPAAKTAQGILQFFENARIWIVRGFAEATTPQMHQAWGRKA